MKAATVIARSRRGHLKRLFQVVTLTIVGLLMSATAAGVQAMAGPTHHDVQAASSPAPIGTMSHCGGSYQCGHIYNQDNYWNLRITTNWAYRTNPNTWRILTPYQSSASIGVDGEGFWVPSGCTAVVANVQVLPGPGWFMVGDIQHIVVTDLSGSCAVW